jgi:hypothetical protein
MAIQKKSLIAALKTAKTENIAGAKPESDAAKVVSTKSVSAKAAHSLKAMNSLRSVNSLRRTSAKKLASTRAQLKASFRSAQ